MEEPEWTELLREGYVGIRKALSQSQAQGKTVGWLTTYLLQAIETGVLPAAIFDRYLDACHHDPDVVRAGLDQTHELIQTYAIRHLIKLIRRSSVEFAKTWNGLGGADGLVKLMGSMSVKHVNLLCHGLGKTAFIPNAREERQQALSDLFQLLWNASGDQEFQNDPRPLRPIYLHLIKSCTPEICLQYATEALQSIPKQDYQQLFHSFQPEAYQNRILDEDFRPVAVEERVPPANLASILRTIRPFLKTSNSTFTLQVFEKAIAGGPTRFDAGPRDILDNLATPLLRQLQKRRRNVHEIKTQVWNLILTSYEKWPHFATDTYAPQWSQYLDHAVSWWKWARSPGSQEAALMVLKKLLELVRPDEHGLTLPRITTLLIRAKLAPPQRYELLTLIMRHCSRFGIVDFENPTKEEKMKLRALKDFRMCEMFTFLPPKEALRLLEMFILPSNTPAGLFVRPFTYPRSMLHQAEVPNSQTQGGVDLDILHVYLRHPASGQAQQGDDVEALLKVRMEKAVKCRDWEGRAFLAKSALFLSIASGDLEVYSRTLAWTARFRKDQKTVAALWKDDILGTREGLRLLAGVPSKTRLQLRSVAQVRRDIERGNRIVSQLLGLVREGLNEPGIDVSTWSYVTSGGLAADIFKTRARFANDFQDYHCLDDDEVDLIWEPTIKMLVDVEAFALEEGHLKHNFCHPAGIVGLDEVDIKKMRPHLWTFFDGLAKERDRLWADVRARKCPKVLQLPDIFPRGLPAHYLVRNNSGVSFDSEEIPYLFSRAEEVFLADSWLLTPLPDDTEMQRAIGGFVESMEYCLRIYLDCEDYWGTTRVERSENLWEQVTTGLTGNRMTREEADIFWRQWLKGWMHFGDNEIKAGRVPLSGAAEAVAKPRYLDAVCLDLMLQSEGKRTSTISQLFESQEWPRYTCIDPLSVNDGLGSGSKKTGEQDKNPEALTASAITALSDIFLRTGGHEAPADSSGKDTQPQTKIQDSISILSSYPNAILVASLRDIARQALERKWQPDLVVSLIKLVVKSRRPGEACSLICDIVTAEQSYSGWHRQLLTLGLLNRLPGQQAKQFIQDIGDKISSGLEGPRPEGEAAVTGGSAQPAVKITTVKMLAEILRTTRAVDVHTSTAILTRVFCAARHIDIGAAVVQSLLDAFDKAVDDDELREAILVALRDNAVNVAGTIDERCPMSDEDWIKAAAKDARLPEIPETNKKESRPIANLLLGYLKTLESRHPSWTGRWCREIIASILVKSIENNNRRMKLFLEANSIEIDSSEEILTPFPVDPTFLDAMVLDNNCTESLLTGPIFSILKRGAMFQIMPPESIRTIVEAVQANNFIVGGNNAKQHWPSSCTRELGYKSSEIPGFVTKVASLLEDPPHWLATNTVDGGNEISIPQLQDFLYQVVEAVVAEYPATRGLFDKLTRGFLFRHVLCEASGEKTVKGYEAWKKNLRPVAERVIRMVETIRSSPTWSKERLSVRRPRSFPDMFSYTVYMLPLPSTMFNANEEPADWDEISLLCKGIYNLIDQLSANAVMNGVPYHSHWTILTEFVCKDPSGYNQEWMGRGVISSGDFLRIGVELWRLDEENFDEAAHCKLTRGLVFELVNELIQRADYSLNQRAVDRENLLRRAREMVGAWVDSEEAWMRDMALGTQSLITKSDGTVASGFGDSWGVFS